MTRDPDTPRYCDLHTHSSASDGTDAPEHLAALAVTAGLSAFALTDHDTTAGLHRAASAAQRLGIAFVPGIELSADPDVLHTGTSRGTMHLLGFFVDADDKGLSALTIELAATRAQRNPEMVQRLNTLGVRLDYAQVVEIAGGPTAVVGRPHIAQAMVQRGYVKSVHEAFQKYLSRGGAAFVRRDRITAERAIEAVHGAGGLAVLAHPVQLRLDDDNCEQVVARLKAFGLDGLETRHPDHDAGDIARFTRYAKKFSLLPTGGSDYHGQRKAIDLGSQGIDFEIYQRLADAAGVTA